MAPSLLKASLQCYRWAKTAEYRIPSCLEARRAGVLDCGTHGLGFEARLSQHFSPVWLRFMVSTLR